MVSQQFHLGLMIKATRDACNLAENSRNTTWQSKPPVGGTPLFQIRTKDESFPGGMLWKDWKPTAALQGSSPVLFLGLIRSVFVDILDENELCCNLFRFVE